MATYCLVLDTVKKVLQSYRQGQTSAVVGVVPVDKPESYGIMEFDEQKKVKTHS